MKRPLVLLLILSGSLWFSGCQKDTGPGDEIIPVDPHPKTLIFYGNIGEPYYSANVEAAGRAIAAGALSKGHRIIVYHEKSAGSLIYELVRDKSVSKGYRTDTLKKYAAGEVSTLKSADMKRIIGEIREFAPAEHYGLTFGSHARGWIPKDYVSSPGSLLRVGGKQGSAEEDPLAVFWQERENPLTRYLGLGNYTMDVSEFAEAIGDWDWDFVLFDACFMGSVEAVYDLRGVADYLIVSPAEVLIAGFPYERIVKSLFQDWTDMAAVAHAYVNSYATGNSPYATISVVKTSELERLAASVRKIYNYGYNDVDAVAAAKIQAFDAASVHVFYDLDHYIGYWAADAGLYWDFLKQLRKTVVYKEYTDCFFSAFGNGSSRPNEVPIMHYSGLSAFIPTTATARLTSYYGETSWYKAVRGED